MSFSSRERPIAPGRGKPLFANKRKRTIRAITSLKEGMMSSLPNWFEGDVHEKLGRAYAFVQKVARASGQNPQALFERALRGDMEVSVTLREIIRKLFDKKGRRIPEGLAVTVCNANYNFRLDFLQLSEEVCYSNFLSQLHGTLGINTGVTAWQFMEETRRLLTILCVNEQLANITKGVCLPLVIPPITKDDLGTELEWFLGAASDSYIDTFHFRQFHNHLQGRLAGQVSFVPESRQDQLFARRKQGAVVGLYFPQSLQGFSINAAREQMATLPEGFILPGSEVAIAMAMCPDKLARDFHTPGLDMAALSWGSAGCSLGFCADDAGLYFSSPADSLSHASDFYSGGLLFIG